MKASILLALLAALLLLVSVPAAQNSLTFEGAITALDTAQGRLSVNGVPLRTDAATRIQAANGNRIAFAQLVLGESVRVTTVAGSGAPALAERIRELGGAPAGPALLSLDVPPGSEAQPVVRVYGDDAGDVLGSYGVDGIAFGDLNGDGFDDLVVGASAADHPSGAVAGEVTILYGSADLPASSIDLDTDGLLSAHGETRIVAGAANQALGSALACGDFDGDGIDDLFIGAPGAGPGGQVVVLYGSRFLPATRVDLGLPGLHTVLRTDEQQADLGTSLASGDIDGDGRADLLIGAPGTTPFASQQGGKVYVVYGRAGARGAVLTLQPSGASGPADETRILGERDGDRAGSSVASGDVNGDGFDDVLLAAARADALFTTDRGAAYVVYGGAQLRGQRIELGTTLDTPGPAGETRIYGRFANSRLGSDLASGDVDGDGFDDVLLGADGVTGVGDNFAVGEVYLFRGGAHLPGTRLDLRNAQGTHGEAWITGTEEFGGLGAALAVADVDGDGFDDLLLGAPGSVPLGQDDDPVVSDGLVFLFRGAPTLPGRHLVDPREVADLTVVRDNANDAWGQTLAAGGDLDRNGVSEYAASASGGDNPALGGENSAGYVAGIFGAPRTPTATRMEHSAAGDARARDFGPVARLVLDHRKGASASGDSVTLLRSAPLLPPNARLQVLPVHWHLASDRAPFLADLTLAYTDLELGDAPENRLAVYTSRSGAPGTWARAGVRQERSTLRNELTVRGVTGPGYFALVALPKAQVGAQAPAPSPGIVTLPR